MGTWCPTPGPPVWVGSIALTAGWAITVDEGASYAQSTTLVLEPGAPRASPLKLGATITFEGGLAPLQVVGEPAHPYTIRRRIDGKKDFLVLDVPGAGNPDLGWDGLQWFSYNGQQHYTLVPLGEQPGAGAAAPLAVGAQCILLFQKDSAIALSPDASGLCRVRFNAKSPATTPLPARALWRVAQCDAATGLPASFTCLGRRFSGHTLAHCRGEGLHGPTPVTLDDTLPHPIHPLPVVCPGLSEVFESDRRKILRLWGHLSGTGEEPLKGSPDELSAGAMLSCEQPAPGVAFPESALLRTDFAPALPVLMVRKLEGAAPPSLHDIATHCKDIVRRVESMKPHTGAEVAFPLGRDDDGNALPLGWAHLGAGLARTSLALNEDPSIFALVLLPPFVYLACLPPEARPAWLKEAAESIHVTHFAPFHGVERLVQAAYAPYPAALVLPPPAPEDAASQPKQSSGKYVPPHYNKERWSPPLLSFSFSS